MHTFEVFLVNNMHQYVHRSTHCQGHLLDIVLTSEHCTIAGLSINQANVSDHALITFSCRLKTNPRKKKVCSGVNSLFSHNDNYYQWYSTLAAILLDADEPGHYNDDPSDIIADYRYTHTRVMIFSGHLFHPRGSGV